VEGYLPPPAFRATQKYGLGGIMMGELPSNSESRSAHVAGTESAASLHGVRVTGSLSPDAQVVLSEEALEFVSRLARRFALRRDRILGERAAFADQVRRGRPLLPPPETRPIRESEWTVVPPAPGLETRWVEILGAPDTKTIVAGLNSKANVFVADFEDLLSPTWQGAVGGQLNLARAVRRTIEYVGSNGDRYRLARAPATLMVRPRGWHLLETHVTVDDCPIPAALFDFGLYVFHNGRELVRTGTGPYFYLPKLEHYPEAVLWQEVFATTERDLGLSPGTIRATAAIETLAATFEMDEILFALRRHSAGLGFGRPGYEFSFLKQFRYESAPTSSWGSEADGSSVLLLGPTRRLVQTCRRRGAPALSATPIHLLDLESGGPGHPEIGRELADKVRAAREGFDGTWVVHPASVLAVREFFTARRASRPAAELPTSRAEPEGSAWATPTGARSLGNVRSAVRASLRYLEARLRGVGSVVVDHRVEDASSVEISRTLLWTWVHLGRATEDGDLVSASIVREILGEETAALLGEAGENVGRGREIGRASRLLERLATDREFPEFLSLVASPD
jgi:malate synthase